MCNAALLNQEFLARAIDDRIKYESQLRLLSESLAQFEKTRQDLKSVIPLPASAAEERLDLVKV